MQIVCTPYVWALRTQSGSLSCNPGKNEMKTADKKSPQPSILNGNHVTKPPGTAREQLERFGLDKIILANNRGHAHGLGFDADEGNLFELRDGLTPRHVTMAEGLKILSDCLANFRDDNWDADWDPEELEKFLGCVQVVMGNHVIGDEIGRAPETADKKSLKSFRVSHATQKLLREAKRLTGLSEDALVEECLTRGLVKIK